MSERAPVAYVLRYWPTLTETFVYREIHALTAAGRPVVVLALGQRADGALQDGLPAVPVLRPPRGWALARAWGAHRSKTAARLDWAAAALRGLGVERVHAHFAGEAAWWARELAVRLDRPWSVTAHAVDLFKPMPGLAALLAEARPVLTVCAHHQRHLRARYGVEAAVVRCAVDPDVPQADPGRAPARVVAVARDVPKKGLERLVTACRALRAPLELLGADRPVPPSQVPEILASAQVFALPVRVAPDGDRDGVPVAMLEAMAAGLPVVTRPIAGVPELVDPSVGWLDLDFERALAQALADPEARAIRGQAARARARAWASPAGSAAALERAWSTDPGEPAPDRERPR